MRDVMPDRFLSRFVALGCAVLVVAACGATVTQTPPIAEATSTAGAPPEVTSTSHGPSPTPDCAALEQSGAPNVDLEFEMPTGHVTIPTFVVQAHYFDGRAATVPDQGDPVVLDLGNVRAGIDLPGTLTQDQEPARVSIDSMESALAIDGKAVPNAGPIEIAGTDLSLAFPDLDGQVNWRLDLTYRDECFVYRAFASATATLGSRATVAACPTGDDGILPYVAALTEEPILVGDTNVTLAVEGADPRWSPGGYSSDGPPLAGWDRNVAPLTTLRGSGLMVVTGNQDLVLDDAYVETFLRADVVRDDVNAERILDAHVQPEAAGRLVIRAPSTSGRYVLLLHLDWSAACATGGAFAIVAVDVS